MSRSCISLLEAQWARGKHLCIGLDTDKERAQSLVANYNSGIVQKTCEIAAAYKVNTAFYEGAEFCEGAETLAETIRDIHYHAPNVPIILDAKRADIGATSKAYARALLDELDTDGITLHPYLGQDAVQPFLDYKEKLCFVLCRTSNKGGGEFQDLLVVRPDGAHTPLFEYVAERVQTHWNAHGNCGLVTGATFPEEITRVRAIAPDMPLLIPGIGTQGGDLEKTVKAARHRFLINSSSGIIFAKRRHGESAGDAARREALALDGAIRALL